jgi:hypothetical protein
MTSFFVICVDSGDSSSFFVSADDWPMDCALEKNQHEGKENKLHIQISTHFLDRIFKWPKSMPSYSAVHPAH